MSTLRRRAWRDLTRRRARSFFTVVTIAAAVMGLWLFAVPVLIDDAMTARAERDLLWDVRFSPNGIELADEDIEAIRALPNVAGVEARVVVSLAAFDQGRRTQVLLVGVDDFADQEVNAVHLSEGRIPGTGEVLADPQNTRSGRFLSGLDERFTVGGQPVTISGIASSLEWSAYVDDGQPVFYLQLDRLRTALDYPGVSRLDVRLADRAETEATAGAIRSFLASVDPEVTYSDPMRIRPPDSWPEKDQVENIVQLMYVIAGLGVVSASFMVFTTINTVVREQTREIGVIKAVGGSRARIVRSYLLGAGILGALGTLLGVAAGAPLANLLVGFAGRQFSGVEGSFGIPPWVLVLSIVGGIGVTVASALPAILRATRIPVREALVDHGVGASFGRSGLDRALRRIRWLPRMPRMGIRNAARSKARSLSTGVQVGFAVGTFLGFLAMGITVLDVSGASYDGDGGDIIVDGRQMEAGDVIAGVPGVATVSPVLYFGGAIDGESVYLRGQDAAAIAFHGEMRSGNWFTPDEESAAVTVLGPALASRLDAAVGDTVTIETTTALTELRVVGITGLMVNDGDMAYVPFGTALAITEADEPHGFFVATQSRADRDVDAVASAISQSLDGAGIEGMQISTRYVERQAQESQNRTILAILMILGIPVIAIGLIGLVSTMTMNVVERTREIGILRAIGARARHIRRMLRAEALVVAALGWVAAVPFGYLIGTGLVKLLSRTFEVDFAVLYPMWPLPYALAATMAATALVVLLPVRRAVRMRPGEALRYE